VTRSRLGEVLETIKFSHTLFALPFAVMGAFLAARGLPELATLGWIVLAMVGARTAAMAWNRVADAELDAENPRTAGRSIPAGRLTKRWVTLFTAVAVAVFLFACWRLNPLCLALSPIVLLVLLGYPYTKRFTSLAHVVLGLALGLAPVGAWVAVRGAFGPGFEAVVLLGLAVVTWVSGFDTIYACQDFEHDASREGLHSIPKRFGVARALLLARGLHMLAILLLAAVGVVASLGVPYAIGVGIAAVVLHFEHQIVKPDDLSRVNLAFFTFNGFVSIAVGGLGVLDLLIR